MINALEAKSRSQKSLEEKISIMTQNIITEATKNINIAIKVGEMRTTCRFLNENGTIEAINNAIVTLKEFGFKVSYDTTWEQLNAIQAEQDCQASYIHVLNIDWDIEDEQDNS